MGSDGEPRSPEGLGHTMGQGAVLLRPLPFSTGEVEAQRRRGASPRPLQTVSGARLRFQWSQAQIPDPVVPRPALAACNPERGKKDPQSLASFPLILL